MFAFGLTPSMLLGQNAYYVQEPVTAKLSDQTVQSVVGEQAPEAIPVPQPTTGGGSQGIVSPAEYPSVSFPNQYSQPQMTAPAQAPAVMDQSCRAECQAATAPAAKPAPPAKPKANPCAKSHKPLFYQNDFSYLDKPDYTGNCFGDQLKGIGPRGHVDIGGQFRLRYHSERGMGQQAGATRFQNTQNDFLLSRFRLYADVKVSDRLTFYSEGILAHVLTSNPAYVPRGIDRNYGDLLNLFLDLKVTNNATVRVGRQELLFGAQRLVSPLDWANTRRTFDGVRLMQKFENTKVDWFYSQFVPVSFNDFDNSDRNREFYGVYGSHKLGILNNPNLDLYALGSRDTRGLATDKSTVTFGSRLNGSTKSKLLYDFEGMVQTGSFATGADFNAYSWTAGLGRQFENMAWKPKVTIFDLL